MTMWEVYDANKYLRHNPPVHEMLGDWFGCRKSGDEEKPTQQQGTSQQLQALANAWQNK